MKKSLQKIAVGMVVGIGLTSVSAFSGRAIADERGTEFKSVDGAEDASQSLSPGLSEGVLSANEECVEEVILAEDVGWGALELEYTGCGYYYCDWSGYCCNSCSCYYGGSYWDGGYWGGGGGYGGHDHDHHGDHHGGHHSGGGHRHLE